MSDDVTSNVVRPFYFVVVVWGERFRNYFLEYCLPSLLAPGNIPSIVLRRPAKYLVATTQADWEVMQRTAIFATLKRYVEPVFIELPPCPPERPYWFQNIIGHKLCCDIVYRDKAYRLFSSPDAIFSDGSVARMDQLARAGVEVVLKLTVPCSDEAAAFTTLDALGMLPKKSARDTGEPISLSGRQLSSALMQSMHGHSIVNEWDAPYFCGYASTPWWRVRGKNGEDGIVAFGFLWDVMLIDYAAVELHDAQILNDRGWDGDYIMSIVGDLKRLYFIRDSDEMNLMGWNFLPGPKLTRHPFGEVGKGLAFRTSYNRPTINRLHRSFFFIPTRIHTGQTSKDWDAAEQRALRTILTWTDPPAGISRLSSQLASELRGPDPDQRISQTVLPWWRRNSTLWAVFIRIATPALLGVAKVKPVLSRLSLVIKRIHLACVGDIQAQQWISWRLRKTLNLALKKPFNEPRP